MARSGAQRLLWLRAVGERLRQSLFVVPVLVVLGSIVLAEITQLVDQQVGTDLLPGVFDTTVDSARAVLSTIAGATITAASVVLSLTLVAVQLSSSQYSPRSLGNFLGDRTQQFVIGSVLGTFTYSMLVLREVRGPLEADGDPVVPRLAVAVAVLLALAALIGLIASINHTAQSLRVESVLDRTCAFTISAARTRLPDAHAATGNDAGGLDDGTAWLPVGHSGAAYVAAPRSGWVQQLSDDSIVAAAPPGSVLRLLVAPGQHVLAGTPLVLVHPVPPDAEQVRVEVLRSLVIGDRRTLQHDIGFGLVLLEDVALRALSPGINDPNTAVDVVCRMGTVLLEILSRGEHARVSEIDGRTLLREHEPDHGWYVRAAFDGIRRHAATEPRVLASIVQTVRELRDEVQRRRPAARLEFLDDQVAAVAALTRQLPAGDRVLVEAELDSFGARRPGEP